MDDGRTNDALRKTETERLNLLAEIGKRRASVVVAYLTSTRRGIVHPKTRGAAGIDDNDTLIIEPHVHAAKQNGAKHLDLFLMTNGGDAVFPWGLVSMVREYFQAGQFRVILPSVAYSAGSAICLGSDEVVMGPSSVLGPVDLHFLWTNGRDDFRHVSASDFQGLMNLISEQRLYPRFARRRLFDWLAAQADGPAIGSLYRHWKENHRQILNLLNSRRAPLSRMQNERIAQFMLYGVGMHNQSIRRTEARSNGLSFITDVEKTGVENKIRSLFALYREILKLAIPHARPSERWKDILQAGDEWDRDAENKHLSETPVAIVESLHDTNPAYLAYDLRHWGKAPEIVKPPQPRGEKEFPDLKPVAGYGLGNGPLTQAYFVSTRASGSK